MKNKKALLREIFVDLFESDNFDADVIKKHFHPQYQQYVNKEILQYDQFADHIKHLKETLQSVRIDFQQLVAEEDTVCSVHFARGFKKDGSRVVAKVIAFFTFEGDQLIRCEELTELMEGSEEDKDIGSR